MKFSKIKLVLALAVLGLLAYLFPVATFIGLVTITALGNILNGGNAYKMGAISALGSATLNYQLTSYAQGLWNDIKDVVALAERLAPTTPVPGAAGQFKKFDDKNSFMPEKTMRTIGGDPIVISFNATDDSYSCRPQALEVRVDKEEDQAAGSEGGEVEQNLLDQGKIKALVNKVALSHVKDVCDFVIANTPAAQTINSQFSSPDIDPIDVINQQLLTLSQNCGTTSNVRITMDLGVWNTIRSNPKVKSRAIFGAGKDIGMISLDQLNGQLLFPCDIMPANVVYDTTRLNQTGVKARLMAGVLLIHYSVPGATIYDPSAFKSFTVGSAGFLGNVRTYVSPNQLWRGHLVDWSRDIKLTSSLSMQRINVS